MADDDLYAGAPAFARLALETEHAPRRGHRGAPADARQAVAPSGKQPSNPALGSGVPRYAQPRGCAISPAVYLLALVAALFAFGLAGCAPHPFTPGGRGAAMETGGFIPPARRPAAAGAAPSSPHGAAPVLHQLDDLEARLLRGRVILARAKGLTRQPARFAR